MGKDMAKKLLILKIYPCGQIDMRHKQAAYQRRGNLVVGVYKDMCHLHFAKYRIDRFIMFDQQTVFQLPVTAVFL